MKKIQLTKTDHDKTITIHPSDLVVLSLSENPSTGYRWALDKIDLQALELQSSDYLPPATSSIGGGGTRQMIFAVKKAGQLNLALKHWREWEGDASILERFTVTFDSRD